MTIEDPKAMTKPWAVTKQFAEAAGWNAGVRLRMRGKQSQSSRRKTGKTLMLGPGGKPLN